MYPEKIWSQGTENRGSFLLISLCLAQNSLIAKIWVIYLTYWKIILLLKNVEFFFHQISSFRLMLGFMWRHLNISWKNGHQSHGFIQYIFAKNWIAAHWRGFENWKILSCQNKMYAIAIQNIKKVLFYLQFQQIYSLLNICRKFNRMNPSSFDLSYRKSQ